MDKKNLTKLDSFSLPTQFGVFLLTTYATDFADQPNMKYVMVIQTHQLPEIPIIRIHSACLFSETFGSMLCDCGDQLKSSLELIGKKQGIVFYLDQEGRGHGLINKIKEYKLQEKGSDTVDASLKLDLPVDSRKFTSIASILKFMGITKVKIITNNIQKIIDLQKEGIRIIKRIIMKPKINQYNYKYLKVKKEKLQHQLEV